MIRTFQLFLRAIDLQKDCLENYDPHLSIASKDQNADLAKNIEQGFGPNGLGIICVSGGYCTRCFRYGCFWSSDFTVCNENGSVMGFNNVNDTERWRHCLGWP